MNRIRIAALALALAALGAVAPLNATTTPQTLPFAQNWSNTGLITVNDDWSGVPGVMGYRGDDAVAGTGVDPQTIVADYSGVVDVNANQANPDTFTTGGLSEFEIANPVVAFQGSATADFPHVVVYLNTTGATNIVVTYNLRDIDGSADNAAQQVALQYRVGGAGNYTNLPGGYVADASTGPSQATLVTAVSVPLPVAAENQALVEVRIMTSNAPFSDEWIGVDDISITGSTGPTPPTGVGAANPSPVAAGATSLLTVAVTPGANPTSTGITVTGDLTTIGGSATQTFFDDQTNGDVTPGDNIFSYLATVAVATPDGMKSLPFTVADDTPRSSTGSITLEVLTTIPLSATGAAIPSNLEIGDPVRLTVTVTPASGPLGPSTGITVNVNLAAIGGAAAQQFYDDGTNGDQIIGDNVFTYDTSIAVGTATGPHALPASVADAQARTASTNINITVFAATLPIHAVQGSGLTSPQVGNTVTVRGIVTAVRWSGTTRNGFFIQEPDADADADPNTSEGIFVFLSPTPTTVAVGDEYLVSGNIIEFVPSADPFSPPLTEFSGGVTLTELSTGNALPFAITVVPGDVTLGGGVEQLERFEGMRVRVDTLTVVGPTQGFVTEATAISTSTGLINGVMPGFARPLREPGIEEPEPLPGTPCCVPRFDGNPERIRLDTDGQVGGIPIDVPAGATLTNTIGVLDYAFRTYTINTDPLAPPTVTGTLAVQPLPAPTATQFTVAATNVRRLFDTVDDPAISEPVLTAGALATRLNKLSLSYRNILQMPDIVALQEVENLSVLGALAAKINTDAGAPDPLYQPYLVEGNDIGGIDNGFLVKSSRVSVISVTQEGDAATFINPITGLPETLHDRPPLVLRATVPRPVGSPYAITVINVHNRSLSGINGVEAVRIREKRAAQAEWIANYVESIQDAENVVILGDFNAFQFNDGYVDSMGTQQGTPTPASEVIRASGDLCNPDLTNAVLSEVPAERYSFVFGGNAQTLDHALLDTEVGARLASFRHARQNADFAETRHNDAGSPERTSDHDPALLYLELPATNFGELAMTSSTVTELETAGTRTVSVSRSGGADGPVSVDYSFVTCGGAGCATLGADFNGTNGTLSWALDDFAPKNISFDILDDGIDEVDETFTITLSNPSGGATLGAVQSTTVTIQDDECVGADITPPAVTAPADITVAQTGCSGALAGSTGADDAALAAFLAGGSASDFCSGPPVRLAPQVGGVDADNSTFFPVGQTTVTFRYRDTANNEGTATAIVTVTLFYGDLDESGDLDASDLVILANHLVGNIFPGTPPFNAPLGAANLNGGGTIDAVDLVILANRLVGNIACVPI